MSRMATGCLVHSLAWPFVVDFHSKAGHQFWRVASIAKRAWHYLAPTATGSRAVSAFPRSVLVHVADPASIVAIRALCHLRHSHFCPNRRR